MWECEQIMRNMYARTLTFGRNSMRMHIGLDVVSDKMNNLLFVSLTDI